MPAGKSVRPGNVRMRAATRSAYPGSTPNFSGKEDMPVKIGIQELVIVFIVALIVIGPDKLPEYARKLGEALKQFKKYSSEATKEIRESVVEPLQEAQRPLKEAMEPITDLEKTIQKDVRDLQKSFTDIGKEKPEQPKAETETGNPQAPAEQSADPQTPEPEETGDQTSLDENLTAAGGNADAPAAADDHAGTVSESDL